MSLFEGVVRRPVSVLVATATLTVLGLIAGSRLPVALLPTLERPRLVVELPAEGRSPDQLLASIEPLERELLALDGGVRLVTRLDGNGARLVLETEWQTDPDLLRIDVERRLSAAGVSASGGLRVRVDAADPLAVLEIGVVTPQLVEATTLAEEVLLPELARLDGAGRIERWGGARDRVVVRPRAADLASRGLTAREIETRLETLVGIRPLGLVREGDATRRLVLRQSPETLKELRELTIGPEGVHLGDVASVEVEPVPADSSFRLDGRPAVLVELHRAPGANAVTLAGAAERRLRELEGPFVVLRDARREVLEAVTQLAIAGGCGLLLGAGALWILLGSWRPTLGLVIVVPTSLIITLGLFYLLGIGLDVMSLAGLALAAGMLVDSAIVVIEAIAVARGEARGDAEDAELDDAARVARGCREIAAALIAGLATTAVVFLPLVYLEGLARAFFGVQALAITASLAVAMVLSLTLTPVLVHLAGNVRAAEGRHPGRGLLRAVLAGAQRLPGTTLLVVLVVTLAGLAAIAELPRRLVPTGESEILDAQAEAATELTPEALERTVDALDERLAEVPGLARRSILQRSSEEMGNATELRAELAFGNRAARRSGDGSVRRAFGQLPGFRHEVAVRRTAIVEAVERGARGQELEVGASTRERAARLASRVVATLEAELGSPRRMGDVGRAQDVVVRWRAGLGQDAMARLRDQVRAGLGGFDVGVVRLDGVEPEIRLEPVETDHLERLPVRPDVAGSVLPLATAARWTTEEAEPTRWRVDGRPAELLRWDLKDGQGDEAARERLERLVGDWPRAVDERLRLAGSAEEIRRSFSQLRLALGLAVLLILLTVAGIYESWRIPLIVFTTIPVALAGAAASLTVFGGAITVVALLGFVLLAGIVVNNSIVLVDRIERRRATGESAADAARGAADERYRPILATTVTTMLGLIPLAVLGGEGEELRRALVLVLGGGMIAALVGTLVVVPTLFFWIEAVGRRSRERRNP